ncbi:SDR family NAD(P)-dependent oxidoreductase [Streptomyces sp. JV176]|uniref:SDR family oxidoreductase n=1 Tax=Streptomyces sp. JV176 TaxID=858630 RepID=UPI002E783CC5|nr:SDR family NAD(P)-dependent oxidoreductase [Streptomyces sp. JV176]MEE1803325.1 SDR family NAD(P)-dependent oxidoreductase [Streptomyces sp. JV176]
MRRYTDRTVMITGAGQGLGRAMALRFAAEGARLALCDVNETSVQETAARCGDGGIRPDGDVRTSVVDVADAPQVDAWVAGTLETFGRVDVLVNNAGVIRDNRLERMTDDEWDAVVDVSLRGMFHCCRAAFPHMKAQGYGRILSFSSMSWRGNFGQVNYAAAKAGVVGMARTIALEGAPHGVTSNAIAPGLIDTPMLASMNAAGRAKLAARVPLGHIGDPTDIAEAAAYLCSEAAGYVTGVVLDVDGGIGIGGAPR